MEEFSEFLKIKIQLKTRRKKDKRQKGGKVVKK